MNKIRRFLDYSDLSLLIEWKKFIFLKFLLELLIIIKRSEV